MKNARIGLLFLSVFIFQMLESKPQNNKPQQKTKTAKAARPVKVLAKQQVAAPALPIKQETKISEAPLTEFNNEDSVDRQTIRTDENEHLQDKSMDMVHKHKN